MGNVGGSGAGGGAPYLFNPGPPTEPTQKGRHLGQRRWVVGSSLAKTLRIVNAGARWWHYTTNGFWVQFDFATVVNGTIVNDDRSQGAIGRYRFSPGCLCATCAGSWGVPDNRCQMPGTGDAPGRSRSWQSQLPLFA